ncbi:MAG TPA: hypothetical protein ENK43_04735 [Planctomycetes bacterium]|nr:hypothetical protein [Planctomycetota bacterium]
MAKKVRATLKKMDGFDRVLVDNTSVALLWMKKGRTPSEKELNAALRKNVGRYVKVKSLKKKDWVKPAEKYLAKVAGYS